MEASEIKIPNYVFEDRLFQRGLERTLNAELEKLNALLAEQIKLLEQRKELLSDVHEAVQRRWKEEQDSGPDSPVATVMEEARNAE
jgi:hypothetical protein